MALMNGISIIYPNRKTWNCRQPTKYPLDGNSLCSCIVCKATVSSEKRTSRIYRVDEYNIQRKI